MARSTLFSTRTFAATALAAAMFAAVAVPSIAQTTAPAPAATASAPADAKPAHRGHDRKQRMTPEQRQERMAKHAEAFKQKLKVHTQSTVIVYRGDKETARVAGETDPAKLKAALQSAL